MLREVGPDAVAVSVITVLELRHGAERSVDPAAAHHRLDLFLAPMTILPFELEAAERAARIRARLEAEGRRIGDLDCLIAAQALASGLVLVTNNLDEFQRVPGLELEDWVERK